MRSEDLARRFFAVVEARNRRALTALLHPDVTFTAVTSSFALRGRTEVVNRFYRAVFAWPLYHVYGTRFEAVSAHTVRVEGRLQWLNNGHLHDIPATWMLTFRDGKLCRFESDTVRETSERGGRAAAAAADVY